MIIKSMSRKAPTFGQLMDYIARGSDQQTGTAFVRNLYASGADRDAVVGQFLDNYAYLPIRKNGNALYHEVIVLEPQGHLAPAEIDSALQQLAERYCALRAPRQLAWGRVHHDSGFPHIHLMISANEVRSDRRVRMERTYFAKVQRELEDWRERELPDLRARVIYGREAPADRPKQPTQEGEMVRRTREPSAKQKVSKAVRMAITEAPSQERFDAHLRSEGLELYRRGQSWGVIDATGRKYRLKTLGFDQAFGELGKQKTDHINEREVDPRAAALMSGRLAREAEERLHGFDRE